MLVNRAFENLDCKLEVILHKFQIIYRHKQTIGHQFPLLKLINKKVKHEQDRCKL